MKTLSSIVGLTLFLISANAALASKMSGRKLSKYQEAVGIALRQSPLNCTFEPGSDQKLITSLDSAIDITTSGTIENNGAQPMLIFEDVYGYTFRVTTSTDYKKVVFVDIGAPEVCTKEEIGDLKTPKLKSVCNTDIIAQCR